MKLASGIAALAPTALVASALVSGCATPSYHYSQIEGARFNKTPIDTYPVHIVSVDGKGGLEHRVLVDPGLRNVVVEGPPGAALASGQQRTLALNVEPCTRYYLVAVKENRLLSDFSVKIDYQEPVPGCTPPK
jgi:hypothetical protein